ARPQFADVARELHEPVVVVAVRDDVHPQVAAVLYAFEHHAALRISRRLDVPADRGAARLRSLDQLRPPCLPRLRGLNRGLAHVDARQVPAVRHDVEALLVILHRQGRAAAGPELPQPLAQVFVADDLLLAGRTEDVLAVGGRRAGRDAAAAAVLGQLIAVLLVE